MKTNTGNAKVIHDFVCAHGCTPNSVPTLIQSLPEDLDIKADTTINGNTFGTFYFGSKFCYWELIPKGKWNDTRPPKETGDYPYQDSIAFYMGSQ